MLITFFVLATLAWTESSATPFRKVDDSVNGCHKCHPIDNKKINVHLIPHSHNDVGWLKTVDQYYYGMNTSIQQAGVQYIITSIVEALMENSDRRYIQVETAFFWKWWKDQDEEMRKQFKYLVDNGQIEMVNGAWAMNDEACSNYQSTIDQFTLGLRIINETIGQCGIPRVGWQIDAFGHSREQASLLSKMGYDAVFMTRLDTNDKNQRQNKSALDFLWKGSADLDNDSIFTSIFPTVLFNSPEGYCWDYECADDVIDDDPESRNYNIETKVEQFTKKIKEFANYFPTNNIIIPMGGEFQYEAAEMNFINMDSFIRGFNNNTEINVMYSTPSCYVKAINDSRVNLTSKTGDFFPYSTDDHSYWTGFFTSRPNLKRFERIGHNILQATKQLLALSSFNSTKGNENLRYLREVMGTLQHHNAITGTERQHVADDYVRQLTRGIEHAEMNFGQIVDKLLNSSSSLNISLSSCLLSNISICSVSQESDEFVVVVYNPLAWPVTHYVRIPVEHDKFTIQGPDGNEIFDIIPSISTFDFVSIDGKKPAPFDLVFAAKDVPAMGMKLYHVSKNSTRESAESTESLESSESAFQVDNHTNLLKSVTLNGKTLGITQNFYYYLSETGVSDKTNVASGAYLFRPTKSSPESLQGNVTMSSNFTGNLVEEFHQKWNAGNMDIVQRIRWYKDENFIEFDWMVGNISIQDKNGKEIINKFIITDDFDNKNIFYTDSNGREMIQRTKDQRPDYTYNAVTEPVASNYYPVTSKIVIKDEDKNIEIAVLTDRSQGGSSLRKNELELMVHRRTVNDDNVGVGESLNEKEFGTGMYVRGSHFLVIGNAKGSNPDGKSTAAAERILAQKKLVQPLVGLAATSKSFEEMKNISDLSYSALEKAFPENINIITFEPWKDNNTCLLRLEHIMEENEDSDLSDEKIFDNIKTIFKHFDITDVQETTLAANILLEDQVKRPKYSWQSEKLTSMRNGKMAEESSEVPVSLKPMDIKTFIVKLGKKQETNTAGAIKKPVLLIVLVISILIAKF